MKQSFLLAFLVVLFIIPGLARKSNSLTVNDKARLVKIILKNYNFRKDSANWKDKNVNTVYLFAENISPAKVPPVKGIRFVFVTQKEIDELDKTVSDYYKFGEFQVEEKLVRATFNRLYLHPVNGDATVTEYDCRKAAGKWKVKEISVIDFADSQS
jgi:hypothetical protein